MAFHYALSGQDIHTTLALVYADAAERTSDVTMVGYGTNVGKVAQQSDDNSLWIVKAVSPGITWLSLDAITGGSAYDIAVAGTQAAAAADLTARIAYSLAVTGTTAARSAHNLAFSALETAWDGTDAAAAAQSTASSAFFRTGTLYTDVISFQSEIDAKISVTGGTMTGNLVVPNVQLASGTIPMSMATNGTIYYDFSGPAYQFTTVDQSSLHISGTNMASVREIAIVLNATGSHSLTYDTNFSWFESAPPSTITDTKVLVALTSTGNTLSDVLGAAVTKV